METVACEFVGSHVVSGLAALRGLSQQVSNQLAEFPLCSDDVCASMQQRCEFRVVPFVANESVGLKHRFESCATGTSLVSNCGKMFEVAFYVKLVPCEQYSFNIRKILI